MCIRDRDQEQQKQREQKWQGVSEKTQTGLETVLAGKATGGEAVLEQIQVANRDDVDYRLSLIHILQHLSLLVQGRQIGGAGDVVASGAGKAVNAQSHAVPVSYTHLGVYDDAAAEAERLTKEQGYTFAHPFNDPLVIAGQGTIGLEILEQLPDVEQILSLIHI